MENETKIIRFSCVAKELKEIFAPPSLIIKATKEQQGKSRGNGTDFVGARLS